MKLLKFISAALMAALPPLAGMAQEARLEVLPGWRNADGSHVAALSIELGDGWHTYWRSPGDVGIPPMFDWTGSKNLRDVQVSWPKPLIFDSYGSRTIGYKNHVVLPLTLTPLNSGSKIVLSGAIEIGVCKDICIPMQFPVQAELSAGAGENRAINAALAEVPGTITGAQLAGFGCAVDPISDGLRITATIAADRLEKDAEAVMEYADASVWVSGSEISRDGRLVTITSDMVSPSGQPFAIDRGMINVTILGGEQSIEIHGCPARS